MPAQQGYHILISATDANESYLTLAKQRNLDGIIVIGMYPDEFYQEMKKTQIPIVLIDSYCNDHYYHNIRIDDAYGSYLATRYMLENGHSHIAFLTGQMKENGVMKKRLLGYQQALQEFSVPYRKEYVFEGQIEYSSGHFPGAAAIGGKAPCNRHCGRRRHSGHRRNQRTF